MRDPNYFYNALNQIKEFDWTKLSASDLITFKKALDDFCNNNHTFLEDKWLKFDYCTILLPYKSQGYRIYISVPLFIIEIYYDVRIYKKGTSIVHINDACSTAEYLGSKLIFNGIDDVVNKERSRYRKVIIETESLNEDDTVNKQIITYYRLDNYLHGLYVREKNDKIVEIINYKLDKREGESLTFFPSSNMIRKKMFYKLNRKHGTCFIYDIKGNLKESKNYYYGKKHGEWKIGKKITYYILDSVATKEEFDYFTQTAQLIE